MSSIRVQAEDYVAFTDSTSQNLGGQYRSDGVDIELSKDSEDPYSVGWITSNESLTFNANVEQAGVYQIRARAASGLGGPTNFTIAKSGQPTATFNLNPTGGWYSWREVTANNTLTLAGGSNELKINTGAGGFNLNYFDLVRVGDASSGSNNNSGGNNNSGSTPTTNNDGAIRVQAEDYVAFTDSTSQNLGGQYRSDGVDIELSKDSEDPYSVGWITANESLTFDVDVAQAGTYQVRARAASGLGSPTNFTIAKSGQPTATFNLNPTGGWYSWKEVTANNTLTLAGGSNELKINTGAGGFNLNYFDLVKVEDNSIAAQSLQTTVLNFGNTITASNQEQTINGGAGLDTVSYQQLAKGITANLSTGSVTYGLKSSNGSLLKILPLGDSLTRGAQPDDLGGYRDDLWSLLTGKGYNIDFGGNGDLLVGDKTPDKNHGGFSGEGINQIANRTLGSDGLLATYRPDAILLMAGTNDNLRGEINLAPDRLNSFLSQIQQQASGTQVFVGSIPPDQIKARAASADNYNGKIENVVGKHANARFVDVSGQLTTGDLVEDGIHVNKGGNRKIANAWNAAIQSVYPIESQGTPYVDTLNNIENLVGTDYNDTLIGSSIDNILVGGKGDDILTGGNGSDKFVLELGGGFDTITDFQAGSDRIVLSGGSDFGRVYINSGAGYGYSAGDTLLTNDNADKLALLSGIQSNSINASAFAIA